jgi:hypothetical protein
MLATCLDPQSDGPRIETPIDARPDTDPPVIGIATPTPVPTATPVPPTAAPQATAPPPPVSNCDPNYSGACIPPYPPDINCGDITARRFQVIGQDVHGLDGDYDKVACES